MLAFVLESCGLGFSDLKFSMAKPGKAQKQAARGQRLAAALRENLKRRKAQARARAADQAAEGDRADAPGDCGKPDFRRNQGSE